MPKKQMYRVTHKGYIVEGRASSAQNACRLAFRKLIEAKLIKNTPPTDKDSESSFKNTRVEIINE
jgi:hypothetical protein